MKQTVIVACLLTMLGVSLNVPVMAQGTVQGYSKYQVPAETEQKNTTVSSWQLARSQAILTRLKSANNVPGDISPVLKIDDSDQLNAYTDGENLVITTALLSRLTTDDQRAFVISHELSHILLQHIAKTQVRRVGLSLLDSLVVRRYAPQGSLVQLASELGIGLVDKRSSRSFELQADDLGVKLLSQSGYNPQAAIQVFDILKAATPTNHVPEFLQDHPISDSRIRALVQKYKLSPQ
jgi:predicted Zn-dependent protease